MVRGVTHFPQVAARQFGPILLPPLEVTACISLFPTLLYYFSFKDLSISLQILLFSIFDGSSDIKNLNCVDKISFYYI